VSPALVAIASYHLAGTWLSGNVGYRLDRSRYAVADFQALSENDRIGAALSAADAALFGLSASRPLLGLTWTLEWSYALAVGRGAPSAGQSPMRIEGSAQRALGTRWAVGGHLGVSPSGRPALDTAVRIEPRVWLGASLLLSLDPPAPPHSEPPLGAEPTAPEDHVEPPPPTPPLEEPLPEGQIRGRVRSLRGSALRAHIRVDPLGLELDADEKGAFTLDVAPGSYEVTISAPGHVSQTRSAVVEQDGVTILVVDLARSRR
jgi:hypothetical protein